LTQKKRSERYGIEILEEGGNENKPADFASLSDSQWGDPVNYLYPVADAIGAAQATKDFRLTRDQYESGRSSKIVRGRINRLARKYDVEPVKANGPTDPQMYLVGTIQLSDDEEHDGLLRIPAARDAVLDHPWWGDIYLDADLFESFIDNWKTNVVGFDLAIDPDHDPHQGALAWVKDITYTDQEFNLWVEKTTAGDGLGDVWRYASIEYTEDYRDAETGVSYGPTLLGCAATNRPFVHRQDAIQVLSQDVIEAGEPEGASYVLLSSPKTEGNAMDITFDGEEDIVQEPVVTEPTEVELNQPDAAPGPEATEPVNETPTEQPAPAATPASAAPVQGLNQSDPVIDLGDGQVITAQQVVELMNTNAALQQQSHDNRVAEVAEKALARGVAPVVVNTAKQILTATNPLAQATITLSVPGEEGADVDQTVNLFDAVVTMLSLVPGRITEMPLSYAHSDEVPGGGVHDANGNPYLDNRPMTPEEAEQAAKERRQKLGISYTRNAGDAGVAL
jgi:hypothetical protein